MPTNARNSKRVAILYASVASAILISFANPVMAGGVSVSVGGHSVVSVPGGGAGGVGGAVGGIGGSLSSGLGDGVGGISSGLGGASDSLSGGQGFFSGGANFGPRNATGPNFFSGAANFGKLIEGYHDKFYGALDDAWSQSPAPPDQPPTVGSG